MRRQRSGEGSGSGKACSDEASEHDARRAAAGQRQPGARGGRVDGAEGGDDGRALEQEQARARRPARSRSTRAAKTHFRDRNTISITRSPGVSSSRAGDHHRLDHGLHGDERRRRPAGAAGTGIGPVWPVAPSTGCAEPHRGSGYPRRVVMSRSTDQIGRVLSGRYRLIAPVGTRRVGPGVPRRRRAAEAPGRREGAARGPGRRRGLPPPVPGRGPGRGRPEPPEHPRRLRLGRRRRLAVPRHRVPRRRAACARCSTGARGSRRRQALLVGLEATRALDYAHRRGFVHRDIKPANLLFGEDGRLRIADFGLARALAEAAWTEPQGAVLGTARYASPEQAQGEPVDGRADVYSLGLVLIEAVTGTVPFAADTTIGTLMARVGQPVEVPEVARPAAPPARAGRPARGRGPPGRRRPRASPSWPPPASCPGPSRCPSPSGEPTDRRRGDRRRRHHVTTPARPRRRRPSPSASTPSTTCRERVATSTRRRRRRWPWVVLAVLLAAGSVAAAPGSATTPARRRTTCPALIGLTEAGAAARPCRRLRLEDREGRRAQGRLDAGKVLATDPSAGRALEEGDTLELHVSLGNTLAAVPQDLVGKPLAEAARPRSTAGRRVRRRADRAVRRGGRGGHGPGARRRRRRRELPKGSEVPLVVSKGPAAARSCPRACRAAPTRRRRPRSRPCGSTPKRVEEFHDTSPPGKVISSRPGPGAEVPRDSEVEVVVSKGPDVVKVPERGRPHPRPGHAALERAGLTVGEVFGPANGQPVRHEPRRRARRSKRGTTVDIYLRR